MVSLQCWCLKAWWPFHLSQSWALRDDSMSVQLHSLPWFLKHHKWMGSFNRNWYQGEAVRKLLASEQIQTQDGCGQSYVLGAMCFPPKLLIKAGVVLHQEKLVCKLRSLGMELLYSSLTLSVSAFLCCVGSIFWPTFYQLKDSAMLSCGSLWPDGVIRHLSAWLTVWWQTGMWPP